MKHSPEACTFSCKRAQKELLRLCAVYQHRPVVSGLLGRGCSMLAVNNTRERTAELTMAGALYSLILALCVFTTRASGCVGESLYAGLDIIACRSSY